ncbi:NADH-quinone oxidoreductase subunit N [Mucilaginibacter sp. RS28]|uniref:NADH-quinone oxidoreductase subunit N n=1 Tax=Mucilaginibacter straminoryzae TaxID=2932774 RepID=A0A9X2B961_9SPHI|nr:NADH-quinone oxidoreductase subunit N [Mucilaginibacter straminoryzae]MCJ8210136.1 NADH-quinone oxidoreductase subunit N [Mucilaginibacter straminoryzae]
MNELLPLIPGQLEDVLTSLRSFVPELCLSGLFLLVFLTDLIAGKQSAWLCRSLVSAGLLVVLFTDLQQVALVLREAKVLFGNTLILTRTAISFKLIIDFFAVFLALYVGLDRKLEQHPKGLGDLYTIITASLLGLHLMTMSFNLLMLFLSVEMVSLASYLLAAYRSESGFSAEAGLKYVLFGAVSSAVMLYGISLIYSLSGSLNYLGSNMLPGLAAANPVLAGLAVVLTLAGLGFKLSFTPMHFWAPDVYQGAPTPVTAYLSILPKASGFALLTNFLIPFLVYERWHAIDFRVLISVIAIASMIVGNFAAIWQKNIKRMLAYSSIGHTGFLLMAVTTFTAQGIRSLTFYIAAYAIANLAALMLVTYFSDETNAEDLEAYRGLGLKYPVAAVCFTISLISLTGLPATVGFNGKLLVFSSVYSIYQQNHSIWLLLLLITGALTTVVSLFYYIKVPLYLFIKKAEKVIEETEEGAAPSLLPIIIILSFLVILLGIFPDFLSFLL